VKMTIEYEQGQAEDIIAEHIAKTHHVDKRGVKVRFEEDAAKINATIRVVATADDTIRRDPSPAVG